MEPDDADRSGWSIDTDGTEPRSTNAAEWALLTEREKDGALFDRLGFYDDYLERPEEVAGDGEVACRECGEATDNLPAHLGAHGFGLEEYGERYPMAPVERERAGVPVSNVF